MLDYFAGRLVELGIVGSDWLSEVNARAELVRLYRDYYRGNHRLMLTAEQKRMMQVDTRLDRYNINYCQLVIDNYADRLVLQGLDGNSDQAKEWAESLAWANRIDAIQINLREAMLVDGEAFVMADFVAGFGIKWSVEKAWDGETGMLVVYDGHRETIVAALKAWKTPEGKRVNLYFVGRLEKYLIPNAENGVSGQVGALAVPIQPSANHAIPIVHFENKGGVSELHQVIPLQDSLNRTLVSLIMTAELTGFPVNFVRGFSAPQALTPGMMIQANLKDANGNIIVPDNKDEASAFAAYLGAMSMERMEGGSLEPFINVLNTFITQIGTVSNTPLPETMGADAQSGEALKQREIGLLSKIRRAHVSMGNGYEDLLRISKALQDVYGMVNAPDGMWRVIWKDSQVRNDKDILMMASQMQAWGFEREALRILSQTSLLDYSEEDIDRLLAEKARDAESALMAAAGNLNGMGQFTIG